MGGKMAAKGATRVHEGTKRVASAGREADPVVSIYSAERKSCAGQTLREAIRQVESCS